MLPFEDLSKDQKLQIEKIQSIKSNLQLILCFIWLPFFIASLVLFVMGKFDTASRSFLVFIIFYISSYFVGEQASREIKKIKEALENK